MEYYVIERHFVDGKGTLEALVSGVNAISTAAEISKSSNYGIKFGLKLTVDRKRLNPELLETVQREVRRLPLDMWLMYDPENRGPGTSCRQVLFNPTFWGKSVIVASADLDQFVIETKEAQEQLLELMQKTEKEDALYGIGSRDIPVVLAAYENNSRLRIIHELFHSLTAGERKLRVKGATPEVIQNVTPAYAELGESSSGLYVMNFAHDMWPEINRCVAEATCSANLNGFATDYYVVIKASQLTKIATGYVKSKPNMFPSRSEQEEFKHITKLIESQTTELGKTDVSGVLLATLRDDANVERIAKFYPKEAVESVRGLMLKALAAQL